MKWSIYTFYVLFFSLCANVLFAQEVENNNQFQVINIGLSYGYEFSAADLKDRYGNNLEALLSIELMNKKNWVYTIESGIKLGSDVKVDVLEYLRIDGDKLLGSNNALAETYFRERGLYLGFSVGKLFPVSGTSRSGLRASASVGLLAHKIRIVEENSGLPQVFGDNKKIYDRLSRGPAIKQYVGYEHFGHSRRAHFKIGLEATQAFTKEIRAITTPRTKKNRLDMYVGIKGTWFLSFYKDNYESPEIYY